MKHLDLSRIPHYPPTENDRLVARIAQLEDTFKAFKHSHSIKSPEIVAPEGYNPWQDHFNNTRKRIHQAVTPGAETMAILGAGLCNDIPLGSLLTRSNLRLIDLIDLNRLDLFRALHKTATTELSSGRSRLLLDGNDIVLDYTENGFRRICRGIQCDVTGAMGSYVETHPKIKKDLQKQLKENPDQDPHEIALDAVSRLMAETKFAGRTPSIRDQYDLVVSDLVLTQIEGSINTTAQALLAPELLTDEVVNQNPDWMYQHCQIVQPAVIQNHLNNVRRLIAQGGLGLIISDNTMLVRMLSLKELNVRHDHEMQVLRSNHGPVYFYQTRSPRFLCFGSDLNQMIRHFMPEAEIQDVSSWTWETQPLVQQNFGEQFVGNEVQSATFRIAA